MAATTETPRSATTGSFLRWPPPGLESVHGEAWELVLRLGPGGVVLVVPLLIGIGTWQPFSSLGPFARAPWLPVLTSFLGLLLVLSGVERVVRLLRSAVRASEQGHSRLVVLAATADGARDTGFLLQGVRYFAAMPERERAWLLRARIAAALLYVAGSLWLPVGFAAAVVLAGRGAFSSGGPIWYLTLAPAVALLLAGLALRLFEEATLARARRAWNASVRRDHVLQPEIADWNAHYDERFGETSFRRGRAAAVRPLRWSTVLLVLLAVLLLLPVGALTFTSMLGPVLAGISLPNVQRSERRAIAIERLRPYQLPADPALTPAAAGEIANLLAFVGRPDHQVSAVERPPVRTYEQGWLPPELDQPNVLRDDLKRYASLPADRREQYAAIAQHPAHAEFAALARAGAADLAGGHWVTPLPAGMSAFALPIPRFGTLRLGAYAHLGKAVHEAATGQVARADTTLREIISVGLVLSDNSTTLIEGLIGIVIAELGGDALTEFYEVIGRTADARELRAVADMAARVIDARTTAGRPDPQAMLQSAVRVVNDTSALRGLRWELLMSTQLAAACANSNRALFGPDAQQRRYLEQARTSLVRYPSEASLFDLVAGGGVVLPTEYQDGSLSLITRLMTVTLGQKQTASSCASVLRALADLS